MNVLCSSVLTSKRFIYLRNEREKKKSRNFGRMRLPKKKNHRYFFFFPLVLPLIFRSVFIVRMFHRAFSAHTKTIYIFYFFGKGWIYIFLYSGMQATYTHMNKSTIVTLSRELCLYRLLLVFVVDVVVVLQSTISTSHEHSKYIYIFRFISIHIYIYIYLKIQMKSSRLIRRNNVTITVTNTEWEYLTQIKSNKI